MQKPAFELDSRGDVLLVLRFPNSQHFVWDQTDSQVAGDKARGEVEPKSEPEFENKYAPPEDEPLTAFEELMEIDRAQQCLQSSALIKEDGEYEEARFRLSSKHLSLASPVFRAMLSTGWKESTAPVGQSAKTSNENNETKDTEHLRYEITATEWDVEVFVLLMNIMHGHHRKVPHFVDIETLGKFSILVDYYKCHDIAEFFVGLWMKNLSSSLPTSYGRDSTIWLFVSWVFSKPMVFKKMVELAMKESQGPLETMCLPLPLRLLTTIEQVRTNSLRQIQQLLVMFREDLIKGRKGCGFLCSSILLGALVKEMDTYDIGPHQSLGKFSNKSVAEVKSIVLNFETPDWNSDSCVHIYTCKIARKLEPEIYLIWRDLSGLSLRHYQDK